MNSFIDLQFMLRVFYHFSILLCLSCISNLSLFSQQNLINEIDFSNQLGVRIGVSKLVPIGKQFAKAQGNYFIQPSFEIFYSTIIHRKTRIESGLFLNKNKYENANFIGRTHAITLPISLVQPFGDFYLGLGLYTEYLLSIRYYSKSSDKLTSRESLSEFQRFYFGGRVQLGYLWQISQRFILEVNTSLFPNLKSMNSSLNNNLGIGMRYML